MNFMFRFLLDFFCEAKLHTSFNSVEIYFVLMSKIRTYSNSVEINYFGIFL